MKPCIFSITFLLWRRGESPHSTKMYGEINIWLVEKKNYVENNVCPYTPHCSRGIVIHLPGTGGTWYNAFGSLHNYHAT